MQAHVNDGSNRIAKISIFAVPAKKPEFSWSPTMPDVLNTDTIVRLTTADGLIGIGGVCTFTEYGVDKSVLVSLRPLAMGLVGQDATPINEIWQSMQWRRPCVTNTAIAAIDIALWDLAAKRLEKPLHEMLGGARDKVRAYASIPVLEKPAQYIDLIAGLRAAGFTAFKFHYKCQADADIDLMRQVHQAYAATDCLFMFDADSYYSAEDALRVVAVMEELGFIWLEAPFNDHDWSAYRALREKTQVAILPGGNTVVDVLHIQQAISEKCWDAIRIDAATAGGITPSKAILDLAKSAKMNVEFQSWGSAVSVIANLHLTLAHANCDYAEVPVPTSDFTVDGIQTIDVGMNGYLRAPKAAGLGLNVDWPTIEKTAPASLHFP